MAHGPARVRRALLGVHLLLVAACAARAAKIARLRRDGADPWQVAYLVKFVEFPLMWRWAIVFSPPRRADDLGRAQRVQGLRACPQARYDDTAILIHEIGEHGPRSARGAAALKRTCEIHAGTRSGATIYAATLWVFCFEPVRWVDALAGAL